MSMTKPQFEALFKDCHIPHIQALEAASCGEVDGPMRREAWNNTVDAAIQEGALPKSAYDWTHPEWLERKIRPSSRRY